MPVLLRSRVYCIITLASWHSEWDSGDQKLDAVSKWMVKHARWRFTIRTPGWTAKPWHACTLFVCSCFLSQATNPTVNNEPATASWSHFTMLNLLQSFIQLLILITLISPVFFNTIHIPTFSTHIAKLSASCMDGWFKFTPVSAVQKGVIGRKWKPVSRLSRHLDHNAEKKKSLTPIDQIDHCCKHKCFKAQNNLLQLQHLCNQYWSFTKGTTRKQWFKDLLLAGVNDNWSGVQAICN